MKDECNNEDNFSLLLQKSINNIIEKEGFITQMTYKRRISTGGGNYLGELFEVDVKGNTVDGEKETNIFVKQVIPNAEENMKDLFSLSRLYLTELYAYTELFKIYAELQVEANVPETERFKTVKSYDEACVDAIILENMSKKGFETVQRMEVMSIKLAELAIEQLAKFHGLSFVLENRKPLYIESKIQHIQYPYRWDETWRTIIGGIMLSTVNNIKDKEVRKKAEELIPEALDKYRQYYDVDQTPIRCLCHGDFRANNLLLKKIDGEVTEIIPVDLQCMNYGCPVNDIVYFLFFNTDGQFRRNHLVDLKERYYDTLKSFLKYFEMDVDKVFPRTDYENLFRERLDLGLLVTLNFSAMIYAADGEIVDVGAAKPENWKPQFNISFQDFIRDVLEDCTTDCLLSQL